MRGDLWQAAGKFCTQDARRGPKQADADRVDRLAGTDPWAERRGGWHDRFGVQSDLEDSERA
ncbi:hypothetical protein [Micromonospora sp. KC721]|uniref:hypothetical protein n=1 Tax=Micromonospora sp. KC721 TaxID=2530380 RepID=UPI00104C31B6|nr:hypothetical protein [Micromonospora sp. KC721]TDB79897.1 hypothetical protein E1182_10960 [Micromonospora sp. KC721]